MTTHELIFHPLTVIKKHILNREVGANWRKVSFLTQKASRAGLELELGKLKYRKINNTLD